MRASVGSSYDGDRSRLDAGVRRAPPSARSARPIALTLIQREDELRPDLRRKICWKSSCAGTTTSTLFKSNRPVDVWGRLLGDIAADQALLDRLLHHAHVLKYGVHAAAAPKCKNRLAHRGGQEVKLHLSRRGHACGGRFRSVDRGRFEPSTERHGRLLIRSFATARAVDVRH